MNTIELWHDILESRNPARLDELLDEHVILYSPVVFTPQEGKQITTMYLTGAMHVLGQPEFTYTKQIIGENQACLEFETKIGETLVNGVDLISWNEEGKVTEFRVMVRPLKAVNALWQGMAAMLEKFGMQMPKSKV